MVALGGEVGRDVVDLRRHAGQQPVLQLGVAAREPRHPVEALPGVQPVLHPAGGDLGRVAVGVALVDPAGDQALPGVEVAPVTGDRERVGEVETEVELAPLDVPLLVVGEPAVPPVRRLPEVEGHAGVAEPAGRPRRWATLQVAVLRLDRAEDLTRPRRPDGRWPRGAVAQGGQAAHRARLPPVSSDAIRPAVVAASNRSSTVRRPRSRELARQPRVLDQPVQRIGEIDGAVGLDDQPVVAVTHQLGDAGDTGGDHGDAAGHRLHQHVRDPVAVAVLEHPAGQREHAGAAVLLEEGVLGQRAQERDPVLQPTGGHPVADLLLARRRSRRR